MQFPWFRRNFLLRRKLDRVFLDLPDAAIRAFTGRSHWPPYSLRSYVGGARDFGRAGDFFVREFESMGLFTPGARFLDIGCGCGRIALALAAEAEVREIGLSYAGMDVDSASIEWCRRHITPINPRFSFYHADCRNPSYNPRGSKRTREYSFPHRDSSFQLILLTSVLTHTLEDDLRRYLNEASRLLAPGGIVYATLFLYESPEQLSAGITRHGVSFPVARCHYALNRKDYPTNAVAYSEPFVRGLVRETKLSVIEPAAYGAQDLLVLTKPFERTFEVTLGDGWYEMEKNCWRWTKRSFSVHLKPLGPRPMKLRLHFRLPTAVVQQTGPIHLKASLAGAALPECEYATAGDHVYLQALPEALPSDRFTVRFELDRSYGPTPSDPRELGVQVAFFAHCGAGFRNLDPIGTE
jgi:SAM-dependent methyltransferase